MQRHSGRQRPLRLEENQRPVWLEQRAENGAGVEVREVSGDSSPRHLQAKVEIHWKEEEKHNWFIKCFQS